LSLADKLNKTAVHAILVISQIIRKNSKPFRECEVAKKCLQMAAQTLYPEKTAVFQTHQFTNTIDNYWNYFAGDMHCQLTDSCKVVWHIELK